MVALYPTFSLNSHLQSSFLPVSPSQPLTCVYGFLCDTPPEEFLLGMVPKVLVSALSCHHLTRSFQITTSIPVTIPTAIPLSPPSSPLFQAKTLISNCLGTMTFEHLIRTSGARCLKTAGVFRCPNSASVCSHFDIWQQWSP